MCASVVSGCDASPVLQLGEKVLELVALLVELLVVWVWHLSAPARRDARFDAFCLQGLTERGAVIAPVSNQCCGWR